MHYPKPPKILRSEILSDPKSYLPSTTRTNRINSLVMIYARCHQPQFIQWPHSLFDTAKTIAKLIGVAVPAKKVSSSPNGSESQKLSACFIFIVADVGNSDDELISDYILSPQIIIEQAEQHLSTMSLDILDYCERRWDAHVGITLRSFKFWINLVIDTLFLDKLPCCTFSMGYFWGFLVPHF